MSGVFKKTSPSAAVKSAADGVRDLAGADPKWIVTAVRLEVRNRLRGWSSRRIAHMDENDLVQQVFVALYDKDRAALKRFDPQLGEAVPYLRDFTRKRLIELERKYLNRDSLLKAQYSPDGDSRNHGGTPEEWFEYFEKRDLLIDYLKRWGSPEDLTIFYLTVVKGLSNPEVAAREQVSVDHVANRKFAIRKHARACLEQLDRGDLR